MTEKNEPYTAATTMRQMIRDNNILLMTISRFGIPFGFGDSTAGDTCRKNGVDTDTFLAVCNIISSRPYNASGASLPALMQYLKNAHTSFLDVTLPRIRHHLIEGINYTATTPDDVSFLLMKFYDDYVIEVKNHMELENNRIFTYVDSLLAGKADEDFDIASFSENHSHMAAKLNELKDIFIYHYTRTDNGRLSAALFDIIICERDLMSHFKVESQLFVPMVEKLENSLRTSLASRASRRDNEGEGEAPDPGVLGGREKEILRLVARGLANKEIADELCLSVHTVATHRRNISAKLGIHSTAGLTIYAILNHLLDLNDLSPRP